MKSCAKITLIAYLSSCLIFCMLSTVTENNNYSAEVIEKKYLRGYEKWLEQFNPTIFTNNKTTRLYFSGLTEPFTNVVTYSAFNSEQEAHEKIKLAKQEAQTRNVSLLWFVSPQTKPANLSESLQNQGFVSLGSFPIMLCDLATLTYTPVDDPAISIKILTDDQNNLSDWLNVLTETKYYTQEFTEPYSTVITQSFLKGNTEHYAGYYENTLVTTGSILFNDDGGGIYDIATREAFRNRGMATALISFMLRRARELKLSSVCLMSYPHTESFYTRLGFKKLFAIDIYMFQPTES